MDGTLNPCPAGHINVGVNSIQHAGKVTRQSQDFGAAMLLSFPATRNILWDKRPIGTPIILHATHYRNPALVIEEKTLRLAHRFAQDNSSDTYSCLFLASLSVDSDREGICINIDRFEANNRVSNEESLENGLIIPCVVKRNSAKPKTSAEDYTKSVKTIWDRCRSKRKVMLEEFISMHAYCSYHENQQNFLFHMDFTLVTGGVKFKLTPVNAIPVVPTALSKNLAGPLSVSHLHGEPKSGYLTMDQTRKLLLVLESDPKTPSLPLVGVWVSGVSNVKDPFVWACCLRYVFNVDLKERIVTPPEAFVVVVYTPVHSKPEFYECVTTNGQVVMQFDLSSCHEVIQLPKNCLGRAQSPLEVELLAVESGEKKDLFEAALENNRNLLIDKGSNLSFETTNGSDDIMPRSIPAPHYGKASMVKPSVPEVSLLLDENEGNFLPRPVPVPTRMTQAPFYPRQPVPMKKKSKISKGKPAQFPQQQSSSEHASPLVDSYLPRPGTATSAQKASSIPSSPATPQYRSSGSTAVHYPAPLGPSPQQGYPANYPFSSPMYQGFSPYPASSSVSLGPAFTQTQPQMSFPAYQPAYNGGFVAGMPPQMYTTHPQPNVYHQGAPALSWNGNMYTLNPSPGNNPQNANFNPNNVQQMEPCDHQRATQQGSNGVGQVMSPMQPSDRSQQRSSNKSNASPTQTGPKEPTNGVCDNHEEILVKHGGLQGRVSPHRHHRSPQSASAESSPPQQHHQSGSTDSGLHVSDTADPDHVLLANTSLESLKSSVSTSQVPPDVYELLKMQDMQLKMLREQLSQLLAKQAKEPPSQSNNPTTVDDFTGSVPPPSLETKLSHDIGTQSSLVGTPVRKPVTSATVPLKQCTSAAVNTSLWYPEPEQMRRDMSASVLGQQQHIFNLTTATQDISIQAGNLQHEVSSSGTMDLPVQLKSPQLRLKDRQMYEQDGGNMTTDTISFGDLQLTSIQDRTEESIMSEMVVDMPAYNSISPEKHSSSGYTDDESNRSPQLGESVSMYERQNFADTEQSLETRGAENPREVNLLLNNQKQFYQNLMGGVQKFLAKSADNSNDSDLHHQSAGGHVAANGTLEDVSAKYSSLQRSQSEPSDMKQALMNRSKAEALERSQEVETEPENIEEITREQLKLLGISMEKFSGNSSEMSTCFLDPVMLPKISYVSLMLDSESESGAEADALAMKYLTDDQLTELAKVRMNASISRGNRKDLDGLIGASPLNGRSSNVTLFGNNHMSFASKKYLERYGLCDGDHKTAAAKNLMLEETPVKEPMLNVRQVLEKLSEQSFMGDLTVPKVSDTMEETAMEINSTNYNSDTFTALQGKPMSTPAEQRKPSTVFADEYADDTPVRLKPQQQINKPPKVSGNVTGPSNSSQQRHYVAANYNNRNRNATVEGPQAIRPNNAQQQAQPIYTRGGIAPCLNSSEPIMSKTSSDKVLDIERLRELPKLL